MAVLLIYWPECGPDRLEKILSRAGKDTRVIVYAPADLGRLDNDSMRKLQRKNNAVLTNLRGRLQGDLLLAMMTRK